MHRLSLRKRRGFTLIESMLVLVVLGILAVIAIPNFLKFRTNAMQGEAKANLKAWFSAQRAYHQDTGGYSENVQTVGFLPERGNRYAYYFATGNTCITRDASGVTVPPDPNCITVDTAEFPGTPSPAPVAPVIIYTGEGVNPGIPGLGGCTTGMDCNISGLAAGNLDNNNDLRDNDTWWISTKTVAAIYAACGNSATTIVAGEPYLSYDDIDCNIWGSSELGSDPG